MADSPIDSHCHRCGRYVEDPDRRHDGCGGHDVCPYCGKDLQLHYVWPHRPLGPSPRTKGNPAHA